jgi:hypothetical protein
MPRTQQHGQRQRTSRWITTRRCCRRERLQLQRRIMHNQHTLERPLFLPLSCNFCESASIFFFFFETDAGWRQERETEIEKIKSKLEMMKLNSEARGSEHAQKQAHPLTFSPVCGILPNPAVA